MRLGADADKIQFAVSVDRGLDCCLELGRRHQRIGTRHSIQRQKQLADVTAGQVLIHFG
jgi:hypothetical protein